MKYKLEILPTAWEDLKAIEDYYAVQFDVKTAFKVSESILDAIERLEQYPDSGSLTPDSWLNDMGYRMIISGKYVAIHRHIGDSVFIYHIANTQTEYTKLFY
ncbi:type II toxin-antitoxin system RelE/ParE family toxin [Clostridium sp. YIM B02505]|uniref:Type II toxin-antitoxin system RelE/ParE family toxin n=1 Tax=Clostridium yunnanense TaxID=2800325 RepID=A0ABS1ENX8_9CLOT|nr:type II toxin-antitoxin system RelE/ParE family toxin [Clostridium yunnanense]MBK1811067.1 type II toxin-antitoxin system RelE/ParE family toxin [Clostridium yunnanense]